MMSCGIQFDDGLSVRIRAVQQGDLVVLHETWMPAKPAGLSRHYTNADWNRYMDIREQLARDAHYALSRRGEAWRLVETELEQPAAGLNFWWPAWLTLAAVALITIIH